MKAKNQPVPLFFTLIVLFIALVLWFNPIQTSDPLWSVLSIMGLSALLSFAFGLTTDDYSWTDRLWSTLPVAFAWIYAMHGAVSLPLLLSAILVTLWGARLTFNFARRGGYTSGEDYRWPILKMRIDNPFLWQLFNLLFIALYQQVLFVAFTSPLYLLALHGKDAVLTTWSWLAILLFFIFLGIETVADQQQYLFQQSKHGLLPKRSEWAEQYAQGFRSSGLFSKSRHPNYFGELGVWWSIYLFASTATGSWVNWSLVGPVLLTLLFIGSTAFTESITANKYKHYQEYKKQASAILFRFW